MAAAAPVFRFAPSPNGELHLGHALSALLNQRAARLLGGRLLLRIEDIDLARCTPEFEAAIHRDLEWLGIAWEKPVRRQSEHFQQYREALDRLVAAGLVYPAFMSRGEIRARMIEAGERRQPWPRDPDGVPLYPGDDKRLSQRRRRKRMSDGDPFAWRLDMDAALAGLKAPLAWQEFEREDLSAWRPVEARAREWGDVVVARKETPTSYHLSVVVDDALQRVTHVVRGSDLFAATAIQRLLQHHLGLAAPFYFHHRLMLDEGGRKLSKSLGDTGLRSLREHGATPADIRRMVGVDEA